MTLKLIIETLVFAITMLIIIVTIVKRGRISIKYSLVWLISIFLLFLVAIIPNFMTSISKLLGFHTMSNMIFAILIAILLFICISLTIIVSGQTEKIRLLIQEVSMLKKKVDEHEKK